MARCNCNTPSSLVYIWSVGIGAGTFSAQPLKPCLNSKVAAAWIDSLLLYVLNRLASSYMFKWVHCEIIQRLGSPVPEVFSYGIRHISLWFSELWLYASLNHNGMCHVPYESASCTGVPNLCNINFIPLWEWMWCHRVFYVRQDWNARIVVRLQKNMCATTKNRRGWNAGALVETRYDVMTIFKKRCSLCFEYQ